MIQRLGTVSSAAAFMLCLVGGMWILKSCDFGNSEDALSVGIGLYFVGKAFFVGPMLLLTTAQCTKEARP
jgi:hypothetical protein